MIPSSPPHFQHVSLSVLGHVMMWMLIVITRLLNGMVVCCLSRKRKAEVSEEKT